MVGPLEGIKVLSFCSALSGPFATMILADMGAEVIKLERPGAGDNSRGMGDGSERNAYFRYINRNKKGVTLNYKDPAGKDRPDSGEGKHLHGISAVKVNGTTVPGMLSG